MMLVSISITIFENAKKGIGLCNTYIVQESQDLTLESWLMGRVLFPVVDDN